VIVLALLGQAFIGEAFMKGDEYLAASNPDEGIVAFERLCLKPFPDEQAFHDAIRRESGPLTEAAQDEVGQLGTDGKVKPTNGGVWYAERFNLRYFAAGSLPESNAQPQCKVSIRLADPPDQSALAAQIATRLKLGDAHEMKVGPYTRKYWDVPQPTGPAWRILLKSEAAMNGNFMAIVLMKPKG
jgi:hypothetical protein